MKQKILKTIITLTIILNGSIISAQEPMVLSLDSAVGYALKYNKILKNSSYELDKAKQKYKEVRSSGMPQINSTIDYNNFLGAEMEIKFSEYAPPSKIEFNPTSSFKLNVSQLVFSGNYFVGLQLAKLAEQTVELNSQKSESEVKEQVIRAYYLVLISERSLGILATNQLNTKQIYEKTENLAKAGIIERTEVDKLSVMLASIDNAKRSAERQLEMAFNMLRLQLDLDIDKEIKLITSLDEITESCLSEIIIKDTFTIQNNFDYRLMLSQKAILEKQVLFEKSSYLPTLSAYYSFTQKILRPAFDMQPKNVVGLSLNIPIFSSGTKLYKLNQAKINVLKTDNTIDLVTQQLSLQDKQLRFNLKNTFEQYETQKMNIKIANEVLESMNSKFKQGMVSGLELTSANNNYLSAESNYTSILYQLLDAELALRKINGKL
jgi:outer membrane protein TolC